MDKLEAAPYNHGRDSNAALIELLVRIASEVRRWATQWCAMMADG